MHGSLFAEKTAHACALIDTVCLQQYKKNVFKMKEEVARLLAAVEAKQENSAVVKQPMKNFLTMTGKTGEQICTVTASLVQGEKEVWELMKRRNVAILELSKLREDKERAENGEDGLQAKLQRSQRGRKDRLTL